MRPFPFRRVQLVGSLALAAALSMTSCETYPDLYAPGPAPTGAAFQGQILPALDTVSTRMDLQWQIPSSEFALRPYRFQIRSGGPEQPPAFIHVLSSASGRDTILVPRRVAVGQSEVACLVRDSSWVVVPALKFSARANGQVTP